MKLASLALATMSFFVMLGCAGKTIDVGSAANGAEPSDAAATPPPVTIVLAGTTYQPPVCGAGGGFTDEDWVGPSFTAATESDCPWPATNPSFWIDVLLRGFLASAGFPPGTYDLADPKLANLAVNVEAASQAEAPVGGPRRPYATYSSSAAACSLGANGPPVPGPGVSGKVTIGRYQTVTNAFGEPSTVYDVTLSDVVLSICQGADATGFPPTVAIPYAHLATKT
jgi:hypothetical protein